MKNTRIIATITIFLISMSATCVKAQNRDARSRSAQAAYGYPAEFKTSKKKAKKQKKAAKKKGEGTSVQEEESVG